MGRLVSECEGCSGAEIEEIVQRAFNGVLSLFFQAVEADEAKEKLVLAQAATAEAAAASSASAPQPATALLTPPAALAIKEEKTPGSPSEPGSSGSSASTADSAAGVAPLSSPVVQKEKPKPLSMDERMDLVLARPETARVNEHLLLMIIRSVTADKRGRARVHSFSQQKASFLPMNGHSHGGFVVAEIPE